MADAFTANLNLNKQEVAAHNNTWGTILNTNFGYIDSKLGDRTTINTTTGTTTLTETEQKVNVIKLTGTLIAAVTIAFNATGGTWIIDNQMVQGAFAVTVKVTGQTGFTLSALGKTTAYYNGTDMVASSIPVDASSVLPIASGGTGQITALAAAGALKVGMVLLASGTVSSAAALALVLTSYTAYRGIRIVLSGFLPVTDNTVLQAQFSTDGGSNYLSAANYHFMLNYLDDAGSALATNTAVGTSIGLALAAAGVGNASTEGINLVIDMLNQSSTALFTRLTFSGSYMNNSATSRLVDIRGSGCYAVAQDTDAIQFLFSSGNIASGKYAVYGYL